MKRSIYPTIDNSYDPKAESALTVQEYHKKNKDISRILLAAQIIVPPLSFLFLLLFYLSTKCETSNPGSSHKPQAGRSPKTSDIQLLPKDTERSSGESHKSEGSHEDPAEDFVSNGSADNLTVTVAVSFIFSLYPVVISILAITLGNRQSDDLDLKKWYNEDTRELQLLYAIPYVMLTEDLLVLAVFVGIYFSVRCCKCRLSFLSWQEFCTFSTIFPFTNVAVHANHIIIAFIHNQEHAVSVALAYAILLLLNVHGLQFIAKIFAKCISWTTNGEELLEYSKKKESKCCNCCTCICMCTCGRLDCALGLFIFVSIIIDGFYIFIASIYVIIPINNAFDKAPARIRLIYDTLVVALFTYITYNFYIKKKKRNPL